MSNNQYLVKESMIRGLKEILHGASTFGVNKATVVFPYPQSNLENEMVVSKHFSKCIKTFVEHSLSTDINNHVIQIQNINKETWKIDAYNLSKALSDESKLSCIQDNLSNILDSCLKELDETGLHHFNDTEIDISPLLQPEHVIEIAECMSIENPLDVRMNALRVLCKSHFTDTVNGEGWTLLKHKLVDNLSDNNIEIFVMCLKAHAKLASCSSPEAIKECCLNLIESLGRHYYLHQEECKITSFQSMHFYRSVYLFFLLLHTFKEATLNVARFGESKLQEMVENFIHLISINVSSRNIRNKQLISPLEIVAFLDPYANWALNLTHFNLSRQLFFSSLYKNINLIKICIEEILGWVAEPVLPSTNTSRIRDGELNYAVQKYSLFCHCFGILTTICSFGMSVSLFPISLSKHDDLLSLEEILDMLIMSISDLQFSDLLHTKATPEFSSFIAMSIAKMLCFNQINGHFILLKLLKLDSHEPFLSPMKVEILHKLSNLTELNNPLVSCDALPKKKKSHFSYCFISNSTFSSNHGFIRQRRELEHQGSLGDAENSDTPPFEIYFKLLAEKAKQNELKSDPRLIDIMTNIFKNFEKFLGINYALKSQIIKLVGEMYKNLCESFKNPETKIDVSDINLLYICTQFFLHSGMTPLGFYILQEYGLVSHILYEELRQPESEKSNYAWLIFITKAAKTDEGFSILVSESNSILRKELMHLWNTIDEDCSGSEIPIQESTDNLLRVITLFTLSFKGVKALLNELEDGSEVTLTDDSDKRPSNLYTLLTNFAVNNTNCPDIIHHKLALTVLDVIVSNMDTSIYLLNKFNFQEALLQMQADNRIDDNSDVIVDECSLLRQKIIEKTYLPRRLQWNLKPTHAFPRPDSTLSRTKPRSRGNGEFLRWLSETRPGLHDHSWLKHARKLYRNTSPDDVKGSTILDLLEQVLKISPESKSEIKWQQVVDENGSLEPEEQLAIQLVVRYGAYHRIFQATQPNVDNLSQLILIVNNSLNTKTNDFKGFDWFVASSFIICSGNVEKSQSFLSLMSTLPTAPLFWQHFGGDSTLAQLGNVLELIISEEMPALFYVLQRNGLSWWELCRGWMAQCWWGVLDWPLICHWFTTAILHQPDHLLYFCAALLHSNHDRLLQMAQEGTVYEIVTNPADKFQLMEARTLIDKLYKKYHGSLHPFLVSL